MFAINNALMAIQMSRGTVNEIRTWRKVPTFLSDFKQHPVFSRDRFFVKASNTKFQGNPSRGSPADTCGQKDGHRQRRGGRSQQALFAGTRAHLPNRRKTGHDTKWTLFHLNTHIYRRRFDTLSINWEYQLALPPPPPPHSPLNSIQPLHFLIH